MRRLSFIVVGVAAALAWSPGSAQEASTAPDTFPFAHHFGLSLGGYFQVFDTRAGYSGANNPGGEVDLENQTGLPGSSTNGRLEGYYRFARRHRLDFATYYWNRSATKTLEDTIEWHDLAYDVGAKLKTSLTTQVLKVDYKYSFVQTDKVEAAVSAGFSAFFASIKLAGEARAIGPNGEPTGELSFRTKRTSKVLPVPVVGLHADYAFSRSVIIRAGVEYFKYDAGDWDFSLTDGRVSVDWFPWEHWGFGAGYNAVKLQAHVGAQADRLNVTYKYDGAIAYASMRF